MIDLRPVGYVIGWLVAAFGVSMIAPLLADLTLHAERQMVFAYTAIVTTLAGVAMVLACANADVRSLTIQQSFLFACGIWVVFPLFGAAPFVLGEPGAGVIDALFESMSALTTTGGTVFNHLETLPPGTFVLVDQFVDRTYKRESSFFGKGLVAHVSMAHPVCTRLGDAMEAAAREIGIPHKRGGTYLVMEGPQFSTKAESELYRAWGCDVIGMTNMPEAKLAREAELCYASVAMVTDYDSWHEDHGTVDITDIIRTLTGNAGKARAMVAGLPARIGGDRAPCRCGCDRALDHAILTAPAKRDPDLVAKLDAVAGRVLKG